MKRRRQLTILCIGDHWSDLLEYKALLEKGGYEVLEASGKEEGLEIFLSHPVDAVVINCLRGDDGALLARRLQSWHGHVPILLLSAYSPTPASEIRSVDCFFSNSQPPEMLLAALHGLLSGHGQPFFYRWLDQWKMRNHAEKL